MIEYYQKFFPKNYNKKVSDLIKDLEKLLEIESIPLITTSEKPLSNDFKENLKNDNWDKINQIYYTLYQNEEHLPAILKKFINKKNSSEDYSFIDTFSGCGGLSLGLLQAGFKPILIKDFLAFSVVAVKVNDPLTSKELTQPSLVICAITFSSMAKSTS